MIICFLLLIGSVFRRYVIVLQGVKQQRRDTSLALILLALSVTISSFYIAGNNSNAQRVWTGTLIVIAQFILTLNIFSLAERIIPQLRTINFGYKHILSAITALVTIFSTVAMTAVCDININIRDHAIQTNHFFS